MLQTTFILKRTADGTDTLFSAEMMETYHSVNGAAQESRHVFIEAGLQQIKQDAIKIFEVGFGTGLNALLTWEVAHQNHLEIEYDAIEAFPISATIIETINYRELLHEIIPDAFLKIHETGWNQQIELETKCFALKKIHANFTEYEFIKKYDLIYFDAFAPDKQPEMWEENLFQKIYNALNENGILVTYCAKGEVRRRLQRCGFTVERIPGPPGKREMLRASKKNRLE